MEGVLLREIGFVIEDGLDSIQALNLLVNSLLCEAFLLWLSNRFKGLVHLLLRLHLFLRLVLCILRLAEFQLGLSILHKAQMPDNVPGQEIVVLVWVEG
jgi:hypothetical protein